MENNYVLAVYDIKNDNLNKKVQILNCEEKQSIYDNKKEIEENCQKYLKNKKIKFNYTYQFDKIDKYEFKFVFKKSINNIRNLFCNCYNLISLDLSNFDSNIISDMKNIFNICKSLKYLNLFNFNSNNANNMIYIFS